MLVLVVRHCSKAIHAMCYGYVALSPVQTAKAFYNVARLPVDILTFNIYIWYISVYDMNRVT